MVACEITWGDDVIVLKSAPNIYNPSTTGSVCGIRKVQTKEESDKFYCHEEDLIYLVEFFDGKSIEIPGLYLRKI